MKPQLKLVEVFEERSAPPAVLSKRAYAALLEKLLGQGNGYGKTAPVAAYYLRSLSLVTRTQSTPEGQEQDFEFKPLYLVMDPKKNPTEYGRLAMMEAIMESYAKRMVGEKDINATDYKGSDIWTAKKSSFEFDYIRREGVHEQDGPSNIYDPNPEAYRVCIEPTQSVTIPTYWGEPWTVETGGAIAIREKDVEELSEALRAIREGRMTVNQALFDAKKKNQTRFDVYGMAPGFLKDNYNPVALKEKTLDTCRRFAKPVLKAVRKPANQN